MKLALAQISFKNGDVEFNIKAHVNAILMASKHGVNYLIFPELSLTGYELKLVTKLAFTVNDARLEKLIKICMQNNINVSIGAPIFDNKKLYIGTFIIKKNGEVETYYKIHLHADENNYFSKGNKHHFIKINNVKIASAICADANHEIHVKTCANLEADVYVSGVLFSKSCYKKDASKLASYAKKYDILVLFANYNKPTGGYDSAGNSAVFDKNGLVISANEIQNVLVIVEKNSLKNIGSVIEF